jgi:hypothetical protein
MPLTYEKISTNTLGSSTASVTFSSISGSYTDLVLVINGTLTGSCIKLIYFNGDTGSNYSITTMVGVVGNSGIATGSYAIPYIDVYNSAANPFMNIVKIMNYSNSTTYKTFLARQDAPSTSMEQIAGVWRSTAAITSVRLDTTSSAFATGTTFTLYGIKAA